MIAKIIQKKKKILTQPFFKLLNLLNFPQKTLI
jgi:hypothetical protein